MNTDARSWSRWQPPAFAALSILAVACLAESAASTMSADLGELRDAPSSEPELPPLPRPSSMIAESSPDDEIALTDAITGARLHAQPAPGRIVDLTSDAERVYALAETDDGLLLHAWPWSEAGLGEPVELGGLDGDARVLASPWGYVVFEHAMGQRWRFVGANGPTPAVICGRPQSLHVVRGAETWQLEALVWDDAGSRLELARATVGPAGLSPCEHEALALPEALGSARLAWSELGAERWLFGLRGHDVLVGRLGDDGRAPNDLTELPASSARLEAVVSLGEADHGRERYALLLGPEARLAVVELGPGEAGRSVSLGAHAELALPGLAFERDQYFGRDLLVAGGAVLVATSEGVFAIDVVLAAGAYKLVPRVGSDAVSTSRRGPMVRVGPWWAPE
jgi:hypothetical protein